MDEIKVTDSYLDNTDWRVRENSSIKWSVGGLLLHQAGAVTANYWLSKIYPEEIAKAHQNADFHIHDLSLLSGYCAGWGLKNLLEKGLSGVKGKTSSRPPKHLSTACGQIVNFLGILQNEWSGAQAINGLDTFLAPFIKKEHLTEEQVYQCMQQLIHGLNVPSRWGSQAPFTNISLDWNVPKDLKDKPARIAGEDQDFTYGDCQEEMSLLQKCLFQVYLDGDANGDGFEYPIPTISVTDDFDWENPNVKPLFELTAKYGSPYFANYRNSDLSPEDVRSMCCRLRLDLRELSRKGGGLFGAYDSTGSIGVVTLNLPRIGYLINKEHPISSMTDEDIEKAIYVRLDNLLDLAYHSLEIKRKVITKLLDEGFYPYTKAYLGTFANHFSTIGIVGMNELLLNVFKGTEASNTDIATERGQKISMDILSHIREKLSDFQEESGNLFNLEETPAESTCFRLAKHDLEKYSDIIHQGSAVSPYYTNSTHLPVDYTSDLWFTLDHQAKMQALYTGGTALHIFLDDGIDDWEKAKALVCKACGTSKVPYISLTPTYSVCPVHGYIKGHFERCPKCRDEQIKAYKAKLAELEAAKAAAQVSN